MTVHLIKGTHVLVMMAGAGWYPGRIVRVFFFGIVVWMELGDEIFIPIEDIQRGEVRLL